MIRRPPRSTLDRSSAASDVYKRQGIAQLVGRMVRTPLARRVESDESLNSVALYPVSYTHLRAHETVLDLVCRLLLEKKTKDEELLNWSSTTTVYTISTNSQGSADDQERLLH